MKPLYEYSKNKKIFIIKAFEDIKTQEIKNKVDIDSIILDLKKFKKLKNSDIFIKESDWVKEFETYHLVCFNKKYLKESIDEFHVEWDRENFSFKRCTYVGTTDNGVTFFEEIV